MRRSTPYLAAGILVIAAVPADALGIDKFEPRPQKNEASKAPGDQGGHPSKPVAITSPKDKSVVGNEALATGTVASSAAGDIWVFIWPELAPGKGWPQSPNAAKGIPTVLDRQRGQWSTPVSFGGPPQGYEIVVYTVNAATSKKISKMLMGWAKKKDFPGMTLDELSSGLVEQDRIKVTKH